MNEEDDDDNDMFEFFRSKEFIDKLNKSIDAATWDKGLPKIYMDKDGWIVKHWKDGKIEKIKQINSE